MCGICGIIRSGSNPVDELVLRRMAQTMVHRGPDDDGFVVSRSGGLGFRRLSIIDVEGSPQPIPNEDETVWAVCNGEIYNYLDLRSELSRLGHRFRTRGDAEVIVHAYEEWGDEFVPHLRGMFGLAVLDTHRDRAVLARDRLGIKPLYYANHNGALIFGSELRAVVASDMVSREIDWAAVDLFLTTMVIPAPHTVYRDVRKLLPGHRAVFDGRDLQSEPYWEPPAKTVEMDSGEAEERFDALLREAVALHLQSDVPLGFYLSGGLDSSALVAAAASASGTAPTTYSVGFDEASHNELPYARQIADAFGCDHHELMVTADAAAVLPQIVTACGEPFGDSSSIPFFRISAAATESLTVVVGGDGGDEILAGYHWIRRRRVAECWQRLPRAVRAAVQSMVRGHVKRPTWPGKFARLCEDAELDPLGHYCRNMSSLPADVRAAVYAGPLQDQLAQDCPAAFLEPHFDGSRDGLAQITKADLAFYLPDDILCKVDRMTMIHSLEGRVPFLDHKLVEFCLSLPMDFRLRGLSSKHILKRVMTGVLPEPVLRQRKHGFAVPMARWMQRDLHDEARRLLLSDRASSRGLFHADIVRQMLDEHQAGRRNLGHALWNMLVLEVWFRMQLDGRPVTPDETPALSDL